MNIEDYDDDNLDSFDRWVEVYRRILSAWSQVDEEHTDAIYIQGTVPSANDPRLKVYEDYLNRKDGE